MTIANPHSVSVSARYDLEVKPDCALIKLHFTGEGTTLSDAVASVHRKVSEATDALQSHHPSIQNIHVFDIYFGQKGDRARSEPPSLPRPFAVQGVLIVTPPDEPSILYRILDDGLRQGALLENPQRRPYLSDHLDSAVLYGLVDSDPHESAAIQGCLRDATVRSQTIADCLQKKRGKLITISNCVVEPGMGDPLRRDYSYINKSLPTKFLSPTPQNVVLTCRLMATFEMTD